MTRNTPIRPMRTLRLVLGAALCLGLGVAGCSQKTDTSSQSQEKLRDAPDLGGVKSVYVEADGHGPTAAAAIDDAIQTAVKQVNGTQTATTSVQLNAASTAYENDHTTDFNGSAFEQVVATRSGGTVTDFKIVKPASKDMTFPSASGGKESWTVRIGAHIAKYQASADAQRPRVIVAMPVSKAGSYELGNGSLTKDQVGGRIRDQISTALSQTNRFTVLDTQDDSALNDEADRIASGDVNAADVSRLGQKLAADLIIIPTIEHMEYTRHARQLMMADRELVSYTGGAEISFKVVNATTGVLVMSKDYQAVFPSTSPTTLGAHVDGLNVSAAAMSDLTERFVGALMQKTFPVSVIKLDGSNVILGQGGDLVHQGTTYRAVLLGDDMKDPQTGQDLGRTESDFGTVLVTRVDSNLSYGTLQNAPPLSQAFRPGLIELRDAVAGADAPAAQPASGAAHKSAPPARKKTGDADAPAHAATSSSADKDW